jgi:hypothetical protein
MKMGKPKFIFWGGSHASRLVKSAKQLKLNEKYEILDFTKPGARIRDLYVPNFASYTENDICFVQIFGNSVFKKNISITRNGGRKVIHLNSYEPRHSAIILKEYEYLLEIFKNTKMKIYLCDNVIRHIWCCDVHHDKRTFAYQFKLNKAMKEYFLQNGKVEFVEHWKFLPFSTRHLKNTRNYSKLLPDSVHFKLEIYVSFLENLVRAFGW